MEEQILTGPGKVPLPGVWAVYLGLAERVWHKTPISQCLPRRGLTTYSPRRYPEGPNLISLHLESDQNRPLWNRSWNTLTY